MFTFIIQSPDVLSEAAMLSRGLEFAQASDRAQGAFDMMYMMTKGAAYNPLQPPMLVAIVPDGYRLVRD
jgi:hypothetical protein